MRNLLSFIWELSKIVIIALVIVLPIRYFLFQPFFVRGQSMEPNFEDGDYLIVDELSYKFRDPGRGEVIVFKYPNDPSQKYIKRIIGLPGEIIEIQNGSVAILSEDGGIILEESGYLPNSAFTSGSMKVGLGDDEYFVMGDNRLASSDSRRWGTVPEDYIVGKVFFRAWPPTALAKISVPEYSTE